VSKVIYSVAVSLDGFIAAPDGSFDWLLPFPPDTDFADGFMARIGGILMGRACLDLELSAGGAIYPDRRVAVMTHRPVESLPANVACFAGDLAAPLAWLRAGGGDIWLFGGGQLAGQALAADVIDEIHTAVVPVSLGAGIPLFGDTSFQPRNWVLGSGTHSPSGYFMLTYRKP
jgi:dihydrofolate reductase